MINYYEKLFLSLLVKVILSLLLLKVNFRLLKYIVCYINLCLIKTSKIIRLINDYFDLLNKKFRNFLFRKKLYIKNLEVNTKFDFNE